MSSDIPTTSIQQLIDACAEEWATTGEGVLDLQWHLREGLDVFDAAFDKSKRKFLTPLYLTADDGKVFEGEVTLSLEPDTSDNSGYVAYQLETEFFDYIFSQAGRFAMLHCWPELEPYLADGRRTQEDPKNWWIAYLWHLNGLRPVSEDQQHDLHLGTITYLTLRSLQQLEQQLEQQTSGEYGTLPDQNGYVKSPSDGTAYLPNSEVLAKETPAELLITPKAGRLLAHEQAYACHKWACKQMELDHEVTKDRESWAYLKEQGLPGAEDGWHQITAKKLWGLRTYKEYCSKGRSMLDEKKHQTRKSGVTTRSVRKVDEIATARRRVDES